MNKLLNFRALALYYAKVFLQILEKQLAYAYYV